MNGKKTIAPSKKPWGRFETTEKQRNYYLDWPADQILLKEREEARRKVRIYNQTLETEVEHWTKLLKELLGSTGENVYI